MYKEVDKQEAFMAALNGQQAIILSRRDNGDFMATDLTHKVKQLTEQDGAKFIVNYPEVYKPKKKEPSHKEETAAEDKKEDPPEDKKEESPLRKRIKITDEVGARIITLHDCGWTNSAIAKSIGVAPATIGNYIKKVGGLKPDDEASQET
ncbi:MAG: hypothetical protein LUD72_06605 [Bacteroidales bacterium]|nr:hypothetical protein [Bacteroidales bacterium]